MDFVCKKNRSRWFPWFLSPTPSPVLIISKGNGHNILTSMSLSPSDNEGRGQQPSYSRIQHSCPSMTQTTHDTDRKKKTGQTPFTIFFPCYVIDPVRTASIRITCR